MNNPGNNYKRRGERTTGFERTDGQKKDIERVPQLKGCESHQDKHDIYKGYFISIHFCKDNNDSLGIKCPADAAASSVFIFQLGFFISLEMQISRK